jgi:hypothetical protein
MTAGIAVLIGGGIAVKKIADYALGVKSKKAAAEEERAKRVAMLVGTVGCWLPTGRRSRSSWRGST